MGALVIAGVNWHKNFLLGLKGRKCLLSTHLPVTVSLARAFRRRTLTARMLHRNHHIHVHHIHIPLTSTSPLTLPSHTHFRESTPPAGINVSAINVHLKYEPLGVRPLIGEPINPYLTADQQTVRPHQAYHAPRLCQWLS